MKFHSLLALCGALLLSPLFADSPWLPQKVKRIVITGDSITEAGVYVDRFEAFLLKAYPQRKFEVLDLGLSSETVSGLSEPGHAGGKFPRPCLHTRLDSLLEKTKPDLLLACYGMNDGIYLPFDETRFQAFKDGIQKLHDKATAAKVPIIHITPPVYDVHEQGPLTRKGYEDVLQRYSEWLISKRADGWIVIDLHTPMFAAINKARETQPGFTFAKDKIHPDAAGHTVMADAIIAAFDPQLAPKFTEWAAGPQATSPEGQAFFKAITARRTINQYAWLSAVGHNRPGTRAGLPLDQAEAAAAKIQVTVPR